MCYVINNTKRSKMNVKSCYGCDISIYWNPVKGEYLEVQTNNKHICEYLEKPQIQH
jgi:hypothetical protein